MSLRGIQNSQFFCIKFSLHSVSKFQKTCIEGIAQIFGFMLISNDKRDQWIASLNVCHVARDSSFSGDLVLYCFEKNVSLTNIEKSTCIIFIKHLFTDVLRGGKVLMNLLVNSDFCKSPAHLLDEIGVLFQFTDSWDIVLSCQLTNKDEYYNTTWW